MKKSRIILPAAALLALSSAAAVTGTVAWFTANRIKTISFAGVTAVNPEQGLTLVSLGSEVNCSGAEDETTHQWTVTHNQLRDASYDMSAPALYGAVLNDSTGQPESYEVKTMATPDVKKYNNQNVYFATKFTMVYKVTRVEAAYNQCLVFDSYASNVSGFTDTPENPLAAKNVVKALRIGIKCGTEWVVWAPKATVDTVQNVCGTDLANVEATETVIKGQGSQLANDDTPIAKNTIEALPGYLGVLDATTGLSVDVVTWFEGLDPACENDAVETATAFAASLQFTMKKGAKTA